MCGTAFTSRAGAKRFCTTECRHAKHLQRRPWRDYVGPRGTTGEREVIRKSVVAERDNWTCGICGDPIDPGCVYPDPLSLSIDHVVPRAHGGGHTYANVRAAHLFCNDSRGTDHVPFPRPRPQCTAPKCEQIVPRTAHPSHEDRRATTTQRGYGSEYRRARALALAGATRCVTCGDEFTDGNPATGGHVHARRKGGSLLEGIEAQCRACNYGWKRTNT